MYAIDYQDKGTPAPADSAASVSCEIDGAQVTVPAGTSVMRAAALAGTRVPKLCATDSLKSFGSCRLCLVEIEGRKGYPASCTTEVAAGMKVRTQSPALERLRRNVVELYVSEHPLNCKGCPAEGHCELETAADELGIEGSRYDGVPATPGLVAGAAAVDASNPYFRFDPSLCIVCSRCVRACEETQGTYALTIDGRGIHSKVAASQDEDFLASECVSCGACVEACPTAALSEKTLIAAPMPTRAVTTTCAYCGVGCSLEAEVKGTEVVRMVPNRDGRANQGHACVKGRFAYGYATHPDRITKPMIRASIHDAWREVGWDEAFAHTAAEFRRIQQKYGRDSVGGITSSRCTNEETFLVQKLVRAAFGNNNVDTCARVCHSPTGYGLKHTLGESAGTQEFASVMKADVIVVIGANPTDGHPVFASQLKRRLRQGAQLIVADPRVIDLVRTPHVEAAYHLQLKPGTNVALVNALAHVVVTEGLAKDEFAEARCEVDSYRKWKAFVAEPRNSPEASAAVTGVPAASVRAAARKSASNTMRRAKAASGRSSAGSVKTT
jgi:formate dehydrogenase major subunit